MASMVFAVLLLPAPATTGTLPFASSTTARTARDCSAAVIVTASPVVPHGTRPAVPPASCWRTSARYASSSSAPPRNGVASAVIDPWSFMAPATLPSARLAAPEVLDSLPAANHPRPPPGHEHLRRPGTPVVGARHAHPVRAGAPDGEKRSGLGQHQASAPAQHVGGLADRPHHVHRPRPTARGAHRHDRVLGAVERRANQVVHSRVHHHQGPSPRALPV